MLEWEGYVETIEPRPEGDVFYAVLIYTGRYMHGYPNGRMPDLRVEVKVSRLDEVELEWLACGAVFKWTMDGGDGFGLRFWRHRWTQEEIDEGKAQAAKTMKALGWDEGEEDV